MGKPFLGEGDGSRANYARNSPESTGIALVRQRAMQGPAERPGLKNRLKNQATRPFWERVA